MRYLLYTSVYYTTAGNDVAMPKTMGEFSAEQRRLQEQTRLSQQDAADSLHAYRGKADENELRRRAAADELRRKEMEARQGLHGYRGTFDGKSGGGTPKHEAISVDARAGARRDDVLAGNLAGYQPSMADGVSGVESDKISSGGTVASAGKVNDVAPAEDMQSEEKKEVAITPPTATPTNETAAPLNQAPPAVPVGPAQKTFSFSFGLLCNTDSGDKGAMIGRVMDKIDDISREAIGGIDGAEYRAELKAYLIEAKDDPTYVDESGTGDVVRRIVKVAVPYFILVGVEIPTVAGQVQGKVIGATRAACSAGELADVAKSSS